MRTTLSAWVFNPGDMSWVFIPERMASFRPQLCASAHTMNTCAGAGARGSVLNMAQGASTTVPEQHREAPQKRKVMDEPPFILLV